MLHNPATVELRASRDRLVTLRENYDEAVRGFTWPDVGSTFNWGVDWFDAIARGNNRPALVIAEEDGATARFSFDEMATRSDRVGGWLRSLGVKRGDAVMLMLGNQVELWDSMLAIMKLGAVILPTTTALGTADLIDRMQRGNVRHVIAAAADVDKFDDVPGDFTRIRVGTGQADRVDFADAFVATSATEAAPHPHPQTAPHDPLLLYFTSRTTNRPKLVQHSQVSYPVGALDRLRARLHRPRLERVGGEALHRPDGDHGCRGGTPRHRRRQDRGSWYWQSIFSPQGMIDSSPYHSVRDIVTPMLVIHGDNVYRVPIGEGLRLWSELAEHHAGPDGSTQHKFLYFPDENHWVLKPQHAVLWYETVFAFLDQHVHGADWVRPALLG